MTGGSSSSRCWDRVPSERRPDPVPRLRIPAIDNDPVGSAAYERLPLEECRRLLGPAAPAADEAVAALRDQLYDLATTCLVAWSARNEPDDNSDARYEFEERAAILQFDAKLPRSGAERIAAMPPGRHRRQ